MVILPAVQGFDYVLMIFFMQIRQAFTVDDDFKRLRLAFPLFFLLIMLSESYLIVNETKATPRPEYIRDFVMSLPEIKDFFPEYSDKQLIPIFSSGIYNPGSQVRTIPSSRIVVLSPTSCTSNPMK